jgi:hypothetical protein
LIEDLARSSYKNCPRASQENFHTSTNAEHLQNLIARPPEEDFNKISTRSGLRILAQVFALRRSCRDPCEVPWEVRAYNLVQDLMRTSCGDPSEMLPEAFA